VQSKSIGQHIPPSPLHHKYDKIQLDLSVYHSKTLNEGVYERGLGMFDATRNTRNVQPGIIHMVTSYNLICVLHPTRKFIS
jgi:hypothetical protein